MQRGPLPEPRLSAGQNDGIQEGREADIGPVTTKPASVASAPQPARLRWRISYAHQQCKKKRHRDRR